MSLIYLGAGFFLYGAGFLIYEHGAAAMGMGGAFVAIANDPSAVFHNPAGLAWIKGTRIYAGTTLITSKSSLSLPNWPDSSFRVVDQESQIFYPSTFYLSHSISEKIVAGFGFFSPYGLGAKWPKEYPLKYISISDEMKTFFFNPAIAYKLNESFSLGFGLSYIYSQLSFELVEHEDINLAPLVGLPFPVYASVDVPVTLKASGSGFGLNAGLIYKKEKFSLGLNWRSGFKINFEGDLELANAQVKIPSPYNQLINPQLIAAVIPKEGKASTEFSFPHILGIGGAFQFSEKLTFSADIHYVLWNVFDSYKVEIDVPFPVPGVEFKDKEVKEDWKNSFIFRTGLEYWVNEKFALRTGLLYDQTPQPQSTMDPVLPDADRYAFTGGIGYKSGSFILDVAVQFEKFLDRTSPNRSIPAYQVMGINLGEGTYSTTAFLFGVSFGYIF